MFHLLMKVPRKVCIAVSGGADSMAVLDFLKNNHDVTVAHFNHGTPHGSIAQNFVVEYAHRHTLKMYTRHIDDFGPRMPKGVSKENFWRQRRYDFFDHATIAADGSREALVLAHNLDDAVETWLFSTINGRPDLIPSTRGNIIRPFLLAKKSLLRSWCVRKEIPFLDDPANNELAHPRVRLRNVIIPEILKINPGIYKVVAKKYLAQKEK